VAAIDLASTIDDKTLGGRVVALLALQLGGVPNAAAVLSPPADTSPDV
jgi:hypothetical protein